MNIEETLYATPQDVEGPEECYFYHTIELPGHGVIRGAWDLRGSFDVYMGHVPFAGKRVLELGTANGFLCFEMEKRGAEVVAYDLSPDQRWDLVPYVDTFSEETAEGHRAHIERLNRAWWLGHRLTGSKARMVYGSVYSIPDEIGPVHIATFGCILLHLRDPLLALQRGAAFATETIIVTDLVPRTVRDQVFSRSPILCTALDFWRKLNRYSKPKAFFLPDPERKMPPDAWWSLPPDLICRYLKVLGFPKTRVTYHQQGYCEGSSRPRLYTVVGMRG